MKNAVPIDDPDPQKIGGWPVWWKARSWNN